MPLDFPASPTNGQTYNGYVYSTSVGAWQAKPNAQSPFYTSDTPPGNPVAGDSWFNTNDGTMYIYTYDGNTYQWVEHRSQIAKSQVGLTPVVASTINVSAGTAVANYLGTVTFTTATSISLNNAFTSSYKNYRAIFRAGGSSLGAAIYCRFRKAGVDSASASFFFSGSYSRSTGAVSSWNGNSSSVMDVGRLHTNTADQKAIAIIDILGPANAQAPMYSFTWAGEDSTSPLGGNGNGTYAITDTYDGITFFPSTGTFTGTVTIYGYN